MTSPPLREPIAASWRRAELAGIDPESAMSRMSHADIDNYSPLIHAASPVLDGLSALLEGTTYSTLLVDRDGRVTQRYCADNKTRRAFDDLGVDVGASLLEEAVGTNAPGTALEMRRSVSVHGNEHFATQFKAFTCYGHPIFHPTTRRIEGVLDLTAILEDANPLLRPLVARAVADIEQRLLDGSRVSERELLAAFQAAATRRRPVLAVGPNMFMSNQPAMDLLGTADIALLRVVAEDIGDGVDLELSLESGERATVRAARVGGARGGALLQVTVHAAPRPVAAGTVASPAPILVSGPPGSGRTTKARDLARVEPVTVFTAASALLDGPQAWARNFAAVVKGGQGTVCIDGVDLLPDALVDLVTAHVASGRAPQAVLVSGPLDALDPRAAALVSHCTTRYELPPLANRLHELPDLAKQMLRALGADPGLHFTPGALHALAARSWPGSLRELRGVVEYVARNRATGGVTAEDLPAGYRSADPVRPLARIERAERDAIVAALRDHDGNKVRAAEALGISRTTLYAKMRALRITLY